MPVVAPQNRRVNSLPRLAAQAPLREIGAGEAFESGARVGVTEAPTTKDLAQAGTYFALMDAVGEINGKSLGDYRPWSKTLNQFVPFSSHLDVYDLDALWTDIAEIKRRNPKALAGIDNREQFEKGLQYRGPKADRDRDAVARGNGVAGFAGQALGGLTDPANILGTGAAAKTLWGAIGLAIVEGGSVELAQEGLKRKQAKMAGTERTIGDAVTDVAIASVGSGVLGGTVHGVVDNFGAIKAAPKAVQEALWAKIAPVLPESIRPKMDWDAIGDDMLPDIADAVIGRDNLSEAEADALAIVRREAAIEARNPFVPDGAGVRAHQEGLAAAMQRIFDASTPTGFGAQVPRQSVSRGLRETVSGSTAISSGVVPGDARSVMKSRIKVVESSGSNVARNPNSTALGPYQFLRGTWTRLYKSRYGARGQSDAAIAALRTDPRLNEILMDDLMALNEGALRSNGISTTAGNLYLAHFAGSGGAVKLHRASPSASARSVLGDAVVDANPFLARMSAADVVDLASRKMGASTGSAPTVGRSADIDPEAALRADLDRQQAQVDADRAALDEILPRRPLRDDDDLLPDPIDDGGSVPLLATPLEAARAPDLAAPAVAPRVATAVPDDIAPILPQLRAIVRDRNQSLNELPKLAQALGVDENQLRRGLTEMAMSRELRMNKRGQFARLPQDRGPIDIRTFVARAGGVTEDGLGQNSANVSSKGHRLGRGGRDWHKGIVGGAGPLIRKSGRSIDEMGELLHEAGYFGDPQGPRPTESDVIDAIDRAVNQGAKIYPFGGTREPESAVEAGYARSIFQSEEHEYFVRNLFDEAAARRGHNYDDEAFGDAARIFLTEDVENMDDAVALMLQRESEDWLASAYWELGDGDYAKIEAEYAAARASDGWIDAETIDQSEAFARNAGEGGADSPDAGGQSGLDRADELEPPYLDQGALRAFDDPDGPAATGVVDSLEHDLRATVQSDAVSDFIISPAQIADIGPPGFSIDRTFQDEAFATAVFRDDGGKARAGLLVPTTEEAVTNFGGVIVYVDPAFRRQGIATKLYDLAEQDGLDVARFSGKGDLTPAGAAFVSSRRKAITDPEIAERQAQQAALKAKSPMQAKVDQESTIGSPLFDAVDQFAFRMDEEGDVVNPADLLADIDAEEAMIKNIKDCL